MADASTQPWPTTPLKSARYTRTWMRLRTGPSIFCSGVKLSRVRSTLALASSALHNVVAAELTSQLMAGADGSTSSTSIQPVWAGAPAAS
ncbi:MAG: hypothetical protein JO352_10935 [Chloroflexi bacterium]|nr:hypothetical protein [Chloroflexota bacterium]MBV9599701.1 hypothetical protein [Chloroflexota bacterium]